MEALAIFSADALEAALNEASGWMVLSLDYELGYLLEPHSAPAGWRPDPGRPLARLLHFSDCRMLTGRAVDAWIEERCAALQEEQRIAGVCGWSSGIDEATHAAAVGRIQDWIAAGDCYQVNFTFPLHCRTFGHPLALYRALRERQPVRHGGIVIEGEQAIVSLSPELFLERRGRQLVTRPMKGTARRTDDPQTLRLSPKNRAENVMIVDLLRNDLGRVAETGSVRVESLFEIEAYPAIWQMVSQVSANVGGRSAFDILQALFPCGSITGAPKIRAMQIISELEAAPRRLYTGALGWVAPGGDFSLNVAIRTLIIEADGRGTLGIGSGIVADSVAAEEWRECALKAEFLRGLDPGFCLIETMRREDGTYPRLAGHLQRLTGSASWFGFRLNDSLVREQLAAQPETGLWRVRLTLDKAGRIEVTSTPLEADAGGIRWARLASERIDAGSPLRRHKTSARALYDRALAETAATPEVFDTIFLNGRGEVAEGARSTVFVERDNGLLTPPLSSGALPGVLRAELLLTGRAQEAVLRPDDLQGEFLLGNALRGLVRVRLQP